MADAERQVRCRNQADPQRKPTKRDNTGILRGTGEEREKFNVTGESDEKYQEADDGQSYVIHKDIKEDVDQDATIR